MSNYPMVNEINRLVGDLLAEGGEVFLPGVGKDHHHHRPPSGYNPKRRPDFSGGGWPHCSAGHPSGADEPGGNLPELYRDPTAG